MKFNNSDEFELGYYMKIIDFLNNKKINRENREIWKSHSLIELMNLLKRTKNRNLVTNAIILILTLFEDIATDNCSNRGLHIDKLSKKEKDILIAELKDEFLPN